MIAVRDESGQLPLRDAQGAFQRGCTRQHGILGSGRITVETGGLFAEFVQPILPLEREASPRISIGPSCRLNRPLFSSLRPSLLRRYLLAPFLVKLRVPNLLISRLLRLRHAALELTERERTACLGGEYGESQGLGPDSQVR